MSLRVSHLRLPGGHQLEYAEQGPRNGLPVLMLHGITDSWRSFEPVLPHLPADWRVISLTQRGHGGSDKTFTSYGRRGFAQDAASAIRLLDLDRPIVIGHSMGAANAMRLAIDHPELMRGLVAAGAFASFGDKPELVAFIRETILSLGDEVPRELASSFQFDTVAGGTAPGLMDTMIDECLRTPAAVWRAAFEAILDDDFSGEIQRIAAPTLLIWGSADVFAPREDQDRMLAALPQGTLSAWEGAGHAMHWEQPQRFAEDLIRFARMIVNLEARHESTSSGSASHPGSAAGSTRAAAVHAAG